MAPQFTFVSHLTPNNNDGRRRARSKTACNSCRTKKRRCVHRDSLADASESDLGNHVAECAALEAEAEGGDDEGGHSEMDRETDQSSANPLSNDQETEPLPSPAQSANRLHAPHPGCTSGQTRVLHETGTISEPSPATPRFVGDLNPEARLLDESATPEESRDMTLNKVGLWVQQRPCSNCTVAVEPRLPSYSCHSQMYGVSGAPISDIISMETIAALSEIYFSSIHPIIPILNEQDYRQNYAAGTLPAGLAHAVCLIAAKDYNAENYLKLLQTGDSLVPTRQFCSQLHASIVTGIYTRTTLRKITTVRIMALLSLHHEGCDGAEQASGFNAQAVHGAQSLALHLKHPRDDADEMRRTFWCIWILDKLNSAIHSRPRMIRDADIATEPLTAAESGYPGFDILFRIAKILNKAIDLYCPTNPESITGLDVDYPGFEEIVDEAQGWQLAASTIATLHIFYLATAILSHRLKSTRTLPTSTPSRLRQQLSATQVVRNLSEPGQLNTLHPTPFNAYAVSLALSVSYQQMRWSRLPSDQESARRDFNAACDILQHLRRKWASADVMASLARKISTELKKMPNLEMLRLGRSEVGQQCGQEDDQAPRNSDCDANRSEIVDTASGSMDHIDDDIINAFCGQGTFDLFNGMDDVSWMYLDAENPVNFGILPSQDATTD